MRVKFYSLLAALGIVLGSLALTAGAASASVTDHNPGPQPVRISQFDRGQQFGFQRGDLRQRDFQPRRFFCTREDRRLEFFLLRHFRELNREQRFELRFLERICDDEFFFVSPFQR
jgi:hypothetical protein